jgi:spermidine/putrescine transport system permease protein
VPDAPPPERDADEAAEEAVTRLSGVVGDPAATVRRRRGRRSDFWLWRALATPGSLWLLAFMVAPMYVVLAILFGTIDPILRRPIPVWNPLHWNASQFTYVLERLVGPNAIFAPAIYRTAIYVGIASIMCLLIAYPVAYYAARIANRRRGWLLAALIAPFWISYMMRMLAWVNLLQNDGLVNRVITLGGVWDTQVDWLNGNPVTVVLGLVYGYVPYMILPLYAGLDRIPNSLLEAGRDLGASRFETLRRVTWRMSMPAVITAIILTCLPMLGDYFTSDLLSGSPKTSMVGNLINSAVLTPGQTGQAAAFVLLVLLVSLIPMWIYVRVSREGEGLRS